MIDDMVSEALPPQRPEPVRDGYGRYRLPHPETGEIISWTRATTFSSTVMDERRFDAWKTQRCAVGLARRPDLVAKIATIHDVDSDEGKTLLSSYIKEAQAEGESKLRANVGTGLHEYLAYLDEGYEDVVIPEQWQPDVDAYHAELKRASIHVSRNYIERVCIVPEVQVAGTMDRLGRFHLGGLPFILDVKTGKELKRELPEFAIQITLYAHASHVWDPHDEQLHPMPPINKDTAVIAWVPQGEGRCELHYIDIKEAWETMVDACLKVRKWRSRRNLGTPVLPEETP